MNFRRRHLAQPRLHLLAQPRLILAQRRVDRGCFSDWGTSGEFAMYATLPYTGAGRRAGRPDGSR